MSRSPSDRVSLVTGFDIMAYLSRFLYAASSLALAYCSANTFDFLMASSFALSRRIMILIKKKLLLNP